MLLGLTLIPPQYVNAQVNRSCFNETGFCIEGRIKEYWEQNGGLVVFGFPITDQHQELVEGKPFQVQVFQRNRLELHPENARPYDVLLGRLGVARLEQQNRNWATFAKSQSVGTDCLLFAETGQTLCGGFLAYFRSHGLEFDGLPGKSYAESLALFGYPISQVQIETNASGDTVQTQWFERARFEYHPENPPPYDVLLGLLGSEVRDTTGQVNNQPPPPPPAPVVTCQGVPSLQSSAIYPSQCMTKGTIYWMSIKGFLPNERVGYWLNDPNGIPVVGTRTTYDIGPAGAVDLNAFSSSGSGYYPGVWSWVFEGTTSHHQSIIYFKLVDPAEAGIAFNSINGANRGSKASLSAKTSPNIGCNLDYYTPSGYRSAANGLGKKTTDGSGNVSWTWTIGTDTNPGTGYVAVTCNGVTIHGSIDIG
jgi:hypothetical protein